MILKDILENLENITKKYMKGYGEKEAEIYHFLEKHEIFNFFIKNQGFIIPSINKPKKVVTVNIGHPDIFNTSFKKEINYNIFKHKGESFIKGGLHNTLNVAIALTFLADNKDAILDDTIFIFAADKHNTFNSLDNFIDTLNPELKNELIFINLDMIQDKKIDKDFYIRTKECSFDLSHYLNNLDIPFNYELEEETRDTMLKYVNNHRLSGFNISLPVLEKLFSFNAMVSFFSIERYYRALEKILVLNYSKLDLKVDTKGVSLKKVLSLKNKKNLKKEKEKKDDDTIFKDSLYMTVSELSLDFDKKDLDYFVYYVSTKYLQGTSINLNFIKKKMLFTKMKNIKQVMSKLCEYDVVIQETDSIYKFV